MDAYSVWVGCEDSGSVYWTISKLYLTAQTEAALYDQGFRIVGNHLTVPTGDGQTGGLAGGDSTNLYVLATS